LGFCLFHELSQNLLELLFSGERSAFRIRGKRF
jgi:hypothetical protein